MNQPGVSSRLQLPESSFHLGKLRLIIISLVVFSMGLAVASGVVLYGNLRKKLREESHRKAVSLVNDTVQHFEAFISSNSSAAATMAGIKRLRLALTEPGPVTLKEANDALDLYQSSFKAEVCYIMDRTGLVVASSNRGQPDSFVGQNYAFRPYFQQAILGRETIYPALGVTSGKRGVYLSRPVRDVAGGIAGVAVIKASLEEFVAYFSRVEEGAMVIAAPHGIVFLSSRRDWVFKLLWKPEAGVLDNLSRSKQFGNGPWTWLGMARETNDEALDAEGRRYLMHGRDLKTLPGWRIIYFHDLRIMAAATNSSLRPLGWSIAGSCLLIMIFTFVFLIWGSREIKARMVLEMELRKLSTAVEQSPASIVITDRDGRIEYVNPKFTRVTGYTLEEMRGNNPPILTLGERLPEEYKHLWETILSGREWEGEFQNRKKNGELFWERAVIALLKNTEGAVTHFVAVKEDITERKQAEQALRESRRELSTLLSNLPGMAYRRRNDPLWTIDFISQGCLAITGYSPEELIGNARVSFNELIHPDDRETVRQDVQDSLETRQPFQLVYRLITAGRKTKWIWEQGQGIYREDGMLAAIEGFMADITERRQMEEALKKAQADLQEKNHELGNRNREMEKERALAHKVIESVLPQDLRLPGLRTAVCYRPSRQIGGDFFDAWVLNDQAHFLIGDISGHSISAALMMAVCKGMFQSLGHTLGDPLEIVTTANRMLCPMMSDSQMFLTLVYAVLDLKTSIVWLVSAGHNPIYLLDGTATTTIESTGPALGWDTEDRWETVEHRVLPGAMLFLYTDGLVEAKDAQGREFGSILPEKLLGHRSPLELTTAVVAELERFHPGELEDDMTILAISRDCDEGQTRLGLSFKPCFDRVDDIRVAVRKACADHFHLPESNPNITDFCQAVTELMNNAVEHSGAGSIRADLHFSSRETAFVLTTDGPPFDPTGKAELPEPDASGDWPQGGYGLAIIQRLVDGIEHEYRDGYNRVTLKKTISTAKGEDAGDGNQA